MIEIKHLQTLLTLERTNSVVETARRLCLTQSAISHQIAELEKNLGTSLFKRKTKPVEFTAAGQRLLRLGKETIPDFERAERDITRMLDDSAGRLNISIETHSCFEWLLPPLETFRKEWPGVEIDLIYVGEQPPMQGLQSGSIDLVITEQMEPDAKNIEYIPLFEQEANLILPKDHPALKKKMIKPEDVANETAIIYPFPLETTYIYKYFFKPAGIMPKSSRQIRMTMWQVQLVSNGKGISILPSWSKPEYEEFVEYRPVTKNGMWVTLYAAIRKDSLANASTMDFINIIKGLCKTNLTGIRMV